MLSDAPFPDSGNSSHIRVVANCRQLQLLTDILHQHTVLALDFEATDKYPWTAIPLTMQVAVEEDGTSETFVVVLPRFSHDDLAPLLKELTAKHHLVLAHNANYEYKLLKHHYGVELPHLYDTMLGQQMLTAGDFDNKTEWLKHLGLARLVQDYLGEEMSKDERKTFIGLVPDQTWMPTPEQVVYGAKDVQVLHRIARQQWVMLENEGMTRAAQLRMDAIAPVADMELKGLLVDQQQWREFLGEQRKLAVETEAELRILLNPYEQAWRTQQRAEHEAAKTLWEQDRTHYEHLLKHQWEAWGEQDPESQPTWKDYKTGEMRDWRAKHPNPGPPKYDPTALINLSSPVQVRRAFGALGLEVESTDAMTRQRLLRRADLTDIQRHVLEVYSRHTKLTKLLSSFGESLLGRIRPDTGRLHAEYTIGLTETGRMAGQNPNMQNIPRESALRNAFIADPGCVTITADFKSQELAVSAALSGDKQMRADIMAGRDLYKELALQIFRHTQLDEVSKEERQQCKNALLGITYGLSAGGMVSRYFIERTLAENLLKGVRDRYPDFVKWSDSQVEIARVEKSVQTAAGARRYFRDTEALGWKLGTEPRNAPVQGTAADIVYRVMARLKAALPSDSYLSNVVHDECVVITPLWRAKDMVLVVEREMCAGFNDILPFEQYGIRVGVDVHIAPWWTKG